MRASRFCIPQSSAPDPFRKKGRFGAGTSRWNSFASLPWSASGMPETLAFGDRRDAAHVSTITGAANTSRALGPAATRLLEDPGEEAGRLAHRLPVGLGIVGNWD